MRSLRVPAFKLVVLSGALLCSAAGFAADAKVETLLSNMRNAYRHTKAATYTTQSKGPAGTFMNSFTFVTPDKLYIEITSPTSPIKNAKITIISDGDKIHTKAPGNSTFTDQPYDLNNLERPIQANLESLCFFDWPRQLSTAHGNNMERSTFRILPNQDWNGRKWTVLEETAQQPRVICKYFIDPKTYFIWRTLRTNGPGAKGNFDQDCWFVKFNPNAKVDSGIFKLTKV